jgi:N6-adenosine-specific RNA methylase IME4
MIYTDFNQIPLFKYGVIAADPPWRYDNWSKKGEHKNAVKHYPCMPTEDICALNIGQLAAPTCALFIWGTSPMLPDVLRVINAWGFDYRGKAFCWAKATKQAFEKPNSDRPIDDDYNWRMNLGYGTRSNTEDCWMATTGNPKRLTKGVRELIVAPMREHSRKPDEMFDRAERLFAGPRLDAFSRQARPGWDSFGNEVDKFEAIA